MTIALTIKIEQPLSADILSLKEAIAYELERFGQVRIVDIKAEQDKQMCLGEKPHSIKEKPMSQAATCELVEELKLREGVETHTAGPNQDITVSVNGPAMVLVVID